MTADEVEKELVALRAWLEALTREVVALKRQGHERQARELVAATEAPDDDDDAA